MRRVAVVLSLFAAVALSAAEPQPAPARVVSINLLTDQWLLLLARPGQLASVTWLAQDPEYSPLWEAARRVPLNHGSAEEVLRFRPDLVFAGRYAATATVAMLERLGVRVVRLDYPQTFGEIAAQAREIARLLGVAAEGDRLADALSARVARVQARASARSLRVLEYGQNGWTHGTGTVLDLLLRETGHRNLAAERGVKWMGQLSLEDLVRMQPDGVIVLTAPPGAPAMAYEVYEHAAFRRLSGQGRIVTLPGWTMDFGGPTTVDALESLVSALDRLPAPVQTFSP